MGTFNPMKIYKYLILDLDGSLIYTSKNDKGSGVQIIYIDSHGDQSSSWVHKRPGFDLFLQLCFENCVVGVWSMGQPNYVDAVLKLFPQIPIFTYNWCHCDRKTGGRVYKSLDTVPFHKITEDPILMIDDNPSLIESTSNIDIYKIPEWHPSNKSDNALFELSQLLFPTSQHDNMTT